MSVALQEEFLELAQELDGDQASRQAAEDYLSTTKALYHGAPLEWSFVPKLFTRAECDALQQAAQTMGSIMEKLTAAFLEDSELRSAFRLPAELEKLCQLPSYYTRMIPIARVDIFYNEDTGDFQFCELNTDGSAGMTATTEITRAIQKTATFMHFAERHPKITSFSIIESLIDTLLDTYAQWRQTTQSDYPHTPSIAIVDYDESASHDEVDDIATYCAERGIPAQFVSIEDLRIEEIAGIPCLMAHQGPVHLVYRRAVTSEIAEKPCAGADAMAYAAQEGLACLVGSYRTWPCATKTVFEVLRSPLMERILTQEEQAFCAQHIPYTHTLTTTDDLDRYRNKDAWIIKPAGSYNSLGVVAGANVDDKTWQQALVQASKSHSIIQAYAPQFATRVVAGHPTQAFEPFFANNMEGLYLFNGTFAGVFTRCGTNAVIGEWTNRLNMGCFVVEE